MSRYIMISASSDRLFGFIFHSQLADMTRAAWDVFDVDLSEVVAKTRLGERSWDGMHRAHLLAALRKADMILIAGVHDSIGVVAVAGRHPAAHEALGHPRQVSRAFGARLDPALVQKGALADAVLITLVAGEDVADADPWNELWALAPYITAGSTIRGEAAYAEARLDLAIERVRSQQSAVDLAFTVTGIAYGELDATDGTPRPEATTAISICGRRAEPDGAWAPVGCEHGAADGWMDDAYGRAPPPAGWRPFLASEGFNGPSHH